MLYIQLFVSFLQIGLFSIGGGYAAMPLIQHQVVELHSWLTIKEFTDLVTIAEMTPGPIAVNSATFVGIRVGGIAGALIATFGCIFPSCILVSVLAFIYNRYRSLPLLQSVLECLRPTVVALIAGAGLTILRLVSFGEGQIALQNLRWIGISLFGFALLLLRKFKISPILTMCICGVLNLGLGMLI